jgi:hypothetical protein
MGQDREVIFEFSIIGSMMRVTAIDVATGVEVVSAGAASAPREHLRLLALKKLNYVLGKQGQ